MSKVLGGNTNIMVRVSDYIKNAFSMEDASRIAPHIEEELQKSDRVILDFDGIRFFTTLFFNNAVTKYVVSLGIDEYKRRFSIVNLSEVGKTTYAHSLSNAVSYSKLSEEQRDQAAAIASETLEDM